MTKKYPDDYGKHLADALSVCRAALIAAGYTLDASSSNTIIARKASLGAQEKVVMSCSLSRSA